MVTYKFEYVAGSECELWRPLSDGRTNFVAGIVYETDNYSDVVRLIENGKFRLIEDPAPVVVETKEEEPPKPFKRKVTDVAEPDNKE
jgi:hypothetical protein